MSASCQLAVFFIELLQAPDLDHAHPGKLLLPTGERRLRYAHLAADLYNRCAVLRLV